MIKKYQIILCEGDIHSIDFQIYSILFSDKTILPCGANSILKIKEEKLKEKDDVCAITDRDLLTDDYIKKLREDKIFCLKVRAVENILVIDCVMCLICQKEGIENYEKVISNIKKTLFLKYGKKLNKEFKIEINENNILEFYNPKKVIDTVALMLNMSKKEYIRVFFEILIENDLLKEKVKKLILSE
ncbi:MAG: hypothetical protein IKI57_00330 [Clostridia bacterium]|nr:hypothetical protein [Clostridia bacterium]